MGKRKHNGPPLESQDAEGRRIGEKLIESQGINFEEMIRKTGGLKRERVISSGMQILLFGIVYVLGKLSLRLLSRRGAMAGITMTDTAWRNRLIGARAALMLLFQEIMAQHFSSMGASHSQMGIVDTTYLQVRGKERLEFRLHTQIGPGGELKEIHITDKHTAESIHHFTFEKGKLVLGDSAYPKTHGLLSLIEQEVPFLMRFAPTNVLFFDLENQKMDLYALLQDRSEAFELKARIAIDGPTVRLLFSPLPQAVWEQIEKRKRRKAQKNGTKTRNPRMSLFNQWTFLVTTLPERYIIQELLELYRLRWGIENYFKSMKQGLDLHQIKHCHAKFSEVFLLLNLIAWTFCQWRLSQFKQKFDQATQARISNAVFMKEFLHDLYLGILLFFSYDFSVAEDSSYLLLLDHRRRANHISFL